MYKRSAEIAAIIHRWNEAIRLRDTGTIENMLSSSDALRYVGSADNELWSGDILRRGIGDHFREVPDLQYEDVEIEAFENEAVGWAMWHGNIHFPGNQKKYYHRATFALVLEHGHWKIVQAHVSNPMSNMEKMGVEHEALESLVQAARSGKLGLGNTGMATVMFTDVVDSAALADLMGDQAWHMRIDAHLSEITEKVTNAGGTLVKSLGDGTMSTFTSTRAALGAALEIQHAVISDTREPVLRARVGIHTGEVIENKGDFFGTVVNKAARINAAAAPDEIRVSDATKIMAGRVTGLTFDEPLEITLKGLEGEHRIYRLVG